MNAVAAYAFEDSLFRAVDRKGDPWFMAGDVARILGHRDAEKLTRLLDDDERGTCRVGTPGGTQEVAIISEPGLYRAIIQRRTSAQLAPEVRDFIARFQRWVFHDLLPTIRRTGAYAMPGAAPASNTDTELVVRERELRLGTVAEARRLYGAERARQLWQTLGLPDVPELPPAETPERYSADQREFWGDPVAGVLQSIAEGYNTWTGTAAQLLAEMRRTAKPVQLRHVRWPHTAQALGNALSRATPILARRGIVIERRHSGVRTITVRLVASCDEA